TGRPGGRGGLKRGLIHPDRLHPFQPGRVIDPRGAVVADCGHRGVPADAELAGHRRDRRSVLPDSAADLDAGRWVNYARGAIASLVWRPGSLRAHRVHTAPDPL